MGPCEASPARRENRRNLWQDLRNRCSVTSEISSSTLDCEQQSVSWNGRDLAVISDTPKKAGFSKNWRKRARDGRNIPATAARTVNSTLGGPSDGLNSAANTHSYRSASALAPVWLRRSLIGSSRFWSAWTTWPATDTANWR